MPETEVIYYCDEDGTSPVLDWLTRLGRRDRRAAAKCLARIEELRELGHELRRPVADFLRDGIYELRIRIGRVNHRILYFFHGRNIAVLAQALTKQQEVPGADIERVLARKRAFEAAPQKHSYTEEESTNGQNN